MFVSWRKRVQKMKYVFLNVHRIIELYELEGIFIKATTPCSEHRHQQCSEPHPVLINHQHLQGWGILQTIFKQLIYAHLAQKNPINGVKSSCWPNFCKT